MRKMHYVACTHCGGEYYVEPNLSRALAANPLQPLKCPFCRREFRLGAADRKTGAGAPAASPHGRP